MRKGAGRVNVYQSRSLHNLHTLWNDIRLVAGKAPARPCVRSCQETATRLKIKTDHDEEIALEYVFEISGSPAIVVPDVHRLVIRSVLMARPLTLLIY